jgi:hypothetical protein
MSPELDIMENGSNGQNHLDVYPPEIKPEA